MKTTRYNFEVAVQSAKADNKQWLIDEFKAILEADKDFTRKADYIGLSIASIDDKVLSLDEEIKELQQLKKQLKSAKDLALEIGAGVFSSYGIEKIEGAGISSITLTKPSTITKTTIKPTDEAKLIEAGFYKKVIDDKAIVRAYEDGNYLECINKYCDVTTDTVGKHAKLKVNKRRVSVNNISAKEPAYPQLHQEVA